MKIIVQGYTGKTGKEIYLLGKEKGYEMIGVDELTPLNQYENEENIDLLIDFSSPIGAKNAFEFAFKHHLPLIIGTTNIDEEIIKKWDEIAIKNKLPIYLLENYLPSMEIICDFLKELDPLFNNISISETHHESKKDSPSGTAKMWRRCFKKDKMIPILSRRVKIYTYEHEVHFKNDDEEVIVIHRCLNRSAYAKGVFQIVEQLKNEKRIGIIQSRRE